jgi:anti-sigma28 factor (negative regulator of flagellin synthesis)
MRKSTRDEKAMEWNSQDGVKVSREPNLNPRESCQQALAQVLPFSRHRPKRNPRPEVAPAEKRVLELKARVKKGQYQVETVRLAEKMIREALLENLATARRKGSSGAVR